MKAALNMGRSGVRVGTRLLRLAGELIGAAMQTLLAPRRGEGSGRQHPALWLHHLCRRLLPVFGVELNVTGPVPARGLLVANHLSYLDIIALASRTPCVFVAKSEVKSWPVFGWFARRAGTIFINRRSRRDAVRATDEIRAALDEGVLVVLFPEGTSSDGATVRAFKSSLLEAAILETPSTKLQTPEKLHAPSSKAVTPISAAALRYELSDGDAARDACYWGDHTLIPHLLKLLSKRGVKASLAFSEVGNTWPDRKRLAAQLHAEVSALHAGLHADADATTCRKPEEFPQRFGAEKDWGMKIFVRPKSLGSKPLPS